MISLIDTEKCEQTAQACVIAVFNNQLNTFDKGWVAEFLWLESPADRK